uniref:Uncharacterized protein n=1 Tax=Ixodes ricinus TaxID=34613 RepID=A0A6B0UMM7_IXORI
MSDFDAANQLVRSIDGAHQLLCPVGRHRRPNSRTMSRTKTSEKTSQTTRIAATVIRQNQGRVLLTSLLDYHIGRMPSCRDCGLPSHLCHYLHLSPSSRKCMNEPRCCGPTAHVQKTVRR